MRFVIDPKIFEQYRNLKIGAVLIKNFHNDRRVSAVESLLRGIVAQRGREFKDKDLHEIPMIRVWEEAYGNFGVSPKKYPPSVAALLKRAQAGKEVPHINLLVDLYNYYSLKFLLPIGGEDIDWLAGDLKLAFTKGKEAFRPIGSIDVEEAKEGEVAYLDNGGITCRYWNYRECERTKFTPKSANAVLFIEDLSGMHLDKFGAIVEEVAEGINRYIGGQIETYILTEDSSEMDLGVEGRRTANDGKIPEQEKVFFEKMQNAKKKSLKKGSKSKKTTKGKKDSPQMSIPLEPKEEKFVLVDESLLKEKLKNAMDLAVRKAFPKLVMPDIKIEYPADSSHGDYACNVALQLVRELKMKPQKIAEAVIEQLKADDIVGKVEIAGPGFINFFIADALLNHEMEKILEEKDEYGHLTAGKAKKIIVEYSAPNIAKPLGVHHLLSTCIGQVLYNLFKFIGFEAIAVNHLGDWGTQFGKLIYAYRTWGDKKTVEANPITELQKLYVRFHDEAEKNPELEEEGRREFKKLEDGDPENRELWQWIVDESLKEIRGTYEKLGGIHFDFYHGESFYEDKVEDILKDGKERNIFVKGEEGAYVVQYNDPNVAPFVVQKKDGTTLYSTRDFAQIKYRIGEWHPAKIIYVVDIAQSLHFKQLFLAAHRFPWYHGEGEHVLFGRMHMKDGRMSTRKGNVVLLNEVLDEAIKRAHAIIEEKSPDLNEKEKAAHTLGVGAVKYNILSQNRTTDIVFDWDRMLSLEGNSAPYLEYTYARSRSILRKATDDAPEVLRAAEPLPDPADAQEKTLTVLRLFPKFSEQILLAAQEYRPNILANYLYELAQAFNAFYNSVPVLRTTDEQRSERLKIVEAVGQVMKNGLALLGIEVVEEM